MREAEALLQPADGDRTVILGASRHPFHGFRGLGLRVWGLGFRF